MLFLIYEIFRLLIIYFLSEKKHMSFDHVDCVTVTVDQRFIETKNYKLLSLPKKSCFRIINMDESHRG